MFVMFETLSPDQNPSLKPDPKVSKPNDNRTEMIKRFNPTDKVLNSIMMIGSYHRAIITVEPGISAIPETCCSPVILTIPAEKIIS